MGAPSYCVKCDRGLAWSSIAQVEADAHECPSCGYSNPPNRNRAEALIDLMERIERLEAIVVRLAAGLKIKP